jgi:hypothetical protein
MYVPNSVSVYQAAFIGALSAITSSDKVAAFTDPLSATITGPAAVARAWAEAVDGFNAVQGNSNQYLNNSIQQLSYAVFSGRTPIPADPNSVTPSFYAGLASSMLVLAIGAGFTVTAEGIPLSYFQKANIETRFRTPAWALDASTLNPTVLLFSEITISPGSSILVMASGAFISTGASQGKASLTCPQIGGSTVSQCSFGDTADLSSRIHTLNYLGVVPADPIGGLITVEAAIQVFLTGAGVPTDAAVISGSELQLTVQELAA